jgi:hypothetical protein
MLLCTDNHQLDKVWLTTKLTYLVLPVVAERASPLALLSVLLPPALLWDSSQLTALLLHCLPLPVVAVSVPVLVSSLPLIEHRKSLAASYCSSAYSSRLALRTAQQLQW